MALVVWAGPRVAVAGFATHRRAKALPWLVAGAGDDDAIWRRVLLGGVVVAVLSLLRPGSPGETLDPVGSGESGALASLASWGLVLDVPPTRGVCGVLVVGSGDFFIFGLVVRGLGAGMDIGAAAPDFDWR